MRYKLLLAWITAGALAWLGVSGITYAIPPSPAQSHSLRAASESVLIRNPGFETVSPKIKYPGGGVPPGWIGSPTGVGEADVNWAANGTKIPDGVWVAWLATGDQPAGKNVPAWIGQKITGLNTRKQYWLQIFYNAMQANANTPNAQPPNMEVSYGRTQLANITGISTRNPNYTFLNLPFRPRTSSGLLRIENNNVNGSPANELLIDAVAVIRRRPGQIVIANPSFEASQGQNGLPDGETQAIAGWTISDARQGNTAVGERGSIFANNGAVPDGGKVVALQVDTAKPTSIRQTLRGLRVGKTYVLKFFYNARAGFADPIMQVKLGGKILTPVHGLKVQPVGGTSAYHLFTGRYTATGGNAPLVVSNINTAAHANSTLLLDNFSLVPLRGPDPPAIKKGPTSLRPNVQPKILFTGMSGFPVLDRHYQKELAADGYPTATATYQNLNPRGANVVAVTMGDPYHRPFAGANRAKILHFVRRGGGLLLMVGTGGYAGFSKFWNDVKDFLEPLGAKLLWQNVQDDKHKAIFSWLINYTYYSTSNISRGDPITRGIHRLWYPGGAEKGPFAATYTMRVSPKWNVLVRGDKSASSRSYPSAPPLVAVRAYGKGRIAIVTWDPRYSINDGSSPAYGGYMLGNKGDGFKFLANLYDWLGQPSIKEGRVYLPPTSQGGVKIQKSVATGTVAPPPSISRATLMAQLKVPVASRIYRGIIGVRSNLGKGHATVAAFCRAARRMGLNFLIFTQDYTRMTPAKWRVLKQQCRANSTTDFVAMAGLRINGPSQPGERIVFNLNSWPTPVEVAPNAWPWLLFHHHQWPTMVIVHPHLNKMSPWQLKFYTSLALVTYGPKNKIQDQAFQEYRRLVGSDYRLIPCAVNDISSVPALKAAAGDWLTYTQAASVADIPASLETTYGSGNSFVGNGPVIDDFAEAGGYVTTKYPADLPYYSSAVPGSGMVFKIAISSRNPLARVTMYRNNTVFRRYFPHRRRFSTYVWAVNDKNATYTVTARDSRGHQVISNQIHTYNPIFNYTMCVDKQNSIINTVDGIIPAGFISGFDTGGIWIVAPPGKVAPAGADVTWAALSDFETAPQFYSATGHHGPANKLNFYGNSAAGFHEPVCLWRRGNFSSSDALVSTTRYDGALASATVKYTMFRPKLNGCNFILVDSRVKVKKDVHVRYCKNRPDIILFQGMTNTAINLYSHYSVVQSDGTVKTGKFNTLSGGNGFIPTTNTALSKGGYAACWPSPAGNFAVYPLGDRKYDASLGLTTNTLHSFVSGRNRYRNYLELGLNKHKKIIAAGTVLHAKFLFALDDGKGAPADFQFIRDAYGLAGHPAYQVALQHGRVLGTAYALTMQANDYYVRGSVSKAKLPDDHLGVIVKGVSDNWDAGIYDTKTKILRRVGTYHGAAYVLLDTRKANEFIIGNLVYADKPFIKLTLLKFGRHSLTVIAQNPTDKAVTATVGSLFSGQIRKCPLAAGGTATVHLSRD